MLGVFLARGGPARPGSGRWAGARRAGNARAGRGAAERRSRQKQADDAIYDELAQQYEQFRQVDRTFELVAKAVSPSVVHIVAQKTTRAEDGRRPRDFEETGSGVIVRSDRAPGFYVLTNHHVVEGSKPAKIRVFLRDGRSILPAKVWTDAKADVAVLNSTATICRQPGWEIATRPRSGTG